MSRRISNGMCAWSFGNVWGEPQWRFQLYWPEVKINRTEFHVVFRTILRLVWSKTSRGFGFQVMGFGCGLAWNE